MPTLRGTAQCAAEEWRNYPLAQRVTSNIRRALKCHGYLNQTQLSVAVGLGPDLSLYMTNQLPFDIELLADIANVLNVELADLIAED